MASPNAFYLSIPTDSRLWQALEKTLTQRQADETAAAASEGREPRKLTIQEVILSHCCTVEGIAFVPPKRGKRPGKRRAKRVVRK